MKAIVIGTVLALAFANLAGATEVQNSKQPAPLAVKAPQKMSDTQMDNVVAGLSISPRSGPLSQTYFTPRPYNEFTTQANNAIDQASKKQPIAVISNFP